MKSLKKVFIGAVIAALVGMFTSCTFLQDIAYSITICGTWERDYGTDNANTETYFFGIEGSYTHKVEMADEEAISDNGTWKVSGGKLELTKANGETSSWKVKVEEDTLKITVSGQTFTYTRVGANN